MTPPTHTEGIEDSICLLPSSVLWKASPGGHNVRLPQDFFFIFNEVAQHSYIPPTGVFFGANLLGGYSLSMPAAQQHDFVAQAGIPPLPAISQC